MTRLGLPRELGHDLVFSQLVLHGSASIGWVYLAVSLSCFLLRMLLRQDFFLPSESFDLIFLKAQIAILCTKGFEIMDLTE